MRDENYKIYETLLKSESGLIITPEKSYLLESRLLPIAKEYGLADLDELAHAVSSKSDPALLNKIVEAMTTNKSSFFRDSKPFDHLKDILLPYYLKARATQRKLRIWSAACSSGQEPYSIAMILDEMSAQLAGWDIEIIATDLSNDILAQAQEGRYTQFEVQRGLPIQYLVKYFDQEGESWLIKPELKNKIQFKQFNLLHSLAPLGSFDIIFCRNVLIYFDGETKGEVLKNMRGLMPQDGILLLGGAETVLGISDAFKPMEGERGLYVTADTTFERVDGAGSTSAGATSTTPPTTGTASGTAV